MTNRDSQTSNSLQVFSTSIFEETKPSLGFRKIQYKSDIQSTDLPQEGVKKREFCILQFIWEEKYGE